MEKYPHLKLPVFQGNIERKKPSNFGGGFLFPPDRIKEKYTKEVVENVNSLEASFSDLKKKFSGKIDPTLIYEIEINQSVSSDNFAKNLLGMGIHVLSRYEDGKRLWVVFSDGENFDDFKNKITRYSTPIGKQVLENAFIDKDLNILLKV